MERIAEVRRTQLSLAVFTGASTFSGEPGEVGHPPPLRRALEAHKGDLRILVMQPDCPAWEQYIQGPLETVFEYRWALSKDKVIVHRDENDRRIV